MGLGSTREVYGTSRYSTFKRLVNEELKKSNEDKYLSLLFVCNLYFDKLKLLRYLNIQEGNNAVYYTDESLNLILGNIYLEDKTITIDNTLKSTLIPALIPKNVC